METLLETLNAEQRKAACYQGPADHIMLLAGAGTGKTRTIIARTLFLLEQGVDPRRLLLMTFTRRAAKEMKERLELEVGEQASYITAGTFHHFCLNMMRQRPEIYGIENRNLVDRDDQVEVMRFARTTYIKEQQIAKTTSKDIPKAGTLVNLYSYSRNTLSPLEEYLDKHTAYHTHVKEFIKTIFQCYEARKRTRGYLDFDDILYVFAHTLETVEIIRNYVKDFFDCILVDEMQDTNPVQWKILDQLYNPAKLFCVGDDAQSIYAFRGADFKNVHHFTQKIENSVTLRLEKNYRSTQEILDLANWLLDKSFLEYNKHLTSFRGPGITPVLKSCMSELDEAAYVVRDIIKRKHEKKSFKDIMVMVRSAFAARSLEAELLANKIPYRFIGGMSLLQMAHIKDILALVRCAVNNTDEISWVRILKLFPKIGDVTAIRMFDHIHSLDDFRENKPALKQALLGREDIYSTFVTVFDDLDPKTLVLKAAEILDPMLQQTYPNWPQRKKDIKAVAEIASRYTEVPKFIEEYSLDPEYSEKLSMEDPEEKLTIITIHSAKGTEADICYIFQAREGMFPHSMCGGDPHSIEEERRVLYVAITRAKDELIITRSYNTNPFFSYAKQNISEYFLKSVPSNLYRSGLQQEDKRHSEKKQIRPDYHGDDDDFSDCMDGEHFDDVEFDSELTDDLDVYNQDEMNKFINKFGSEHDQKNREEIDDIPF